MLSRSVNKSLVFARTELTNVRRNAFLVSQQPFIAALNFFLTFRGKTLICFHLHDLTVFSAVTDIYLLVYCSFTGVNSFFSTGYGVCVVFKEFSTMIS